MDVHAAEVVIACRDPDAAARALEPFGFAVELVIPADAPEAIVVAGHGARVRLVRGDGGGGGTIRVTGEPARVVDAAGVRVEIAPPERMVVPAPRVAFAIARGGGGAWHGGRAGMAYRDLVPDRLGGWLIASHIRIADGGPVPDYVHHHAIRVQLIYCRAGWVRLVYEDQGEPFVMTAGDCVTQPPGIRHRVLECSAGLEVIELASPAVHATYADRGLALPTGARERAWDGQRFVWHRAAGATWRDDGGWRVRDLGLDAPTAGLASGRVLRGRGGGARAHGGIAFGFVLAGQVMVRGSALVRDDAFVVPAGEPCALAGDDDSELLELVLAP
jgi:mannose-6-phosphate isomerase-like protein (cupin superfamily)